MSKKETGKGKNIKPSVSADKDKPKGKGKESVSRNTTQPDLKKGKKPKGKRTAAEQRKDQQLRTRAGKKRVLKWLVESLGVVTTACDQAKVSRKQFYTWKEEDEEFRREVDDINEIAIDFVESKLHQNINKGDTTAQIFYLKCRAKKRGYIERTEVENSGEMNININRKTVDGDGKS